MHKQFQRRGGVEHDRHIVVEDEASRHGAGQRVGFGVGSVLAGSERRTARAAQPVFAFPLTTLSSVFEYWQKLQLMTQDDLYLMLMALASSVVSIT